MAAQAWIVAIYLITLAVLLPVGGRLSDVLGAARAFAAGMAVFTVASAGVGLATDGAEIIAWRGVAGCAATLISTVRQVGGVAGIAAMGVLTTLHPGGVASGLPLSRSASSSPRP